MLKTYDSNRPGSAGLDDGADSVKEFLSKARYLVLGLGDVYLGCAIATAIDPRYNPETTSGILFGTLIMWCHASHP